MNKIKNWLSIILAVTIFLSAICYVPIVKAVNGATTDSEETTLSTATLEDDFADNRIIVLLSEAASKRRAAYSAVDFCELGSVKVENLTAEMYDYLAQKQKAGSKSAEERIENFKHVLCVELATAGKENVLAAIKTLEGRDDILYAGPDYVIRTAATPGDPELGNQWAVSNINLTNAWNITTGSSSVTVGVLDSGISASHEDLNGVVDTTLSRDFTGSGGATTDTFGHGTKVAGVIGAKGNNGRGISGVCWNVKLVSLKVIGNNGLGYSSYAYRAIGYATTNDIPILNLSVAWSEDQAGGRYNQVLDTIILNYPGLVVCSAGNDDNNNDVFGYYPSNSALSNVISVGASTQSNAKWVDPIDSNKASNYGSWSVDVFAPGYNIQTTYSGNIYSPESGTSMAAPFVSGIAALLLSRNPNLTGAQMKNIIMNSVDVCPALNGLCVTNGRVNAYKAVTSNLLYS